jgi:hypothetical protein
MNSHDQAEKNLGRILCGGTVGRMVGSMVDSTVDRATANRGTMAKLPGRWQNPAAFIGGRAGGEQERLQGSAKPARRPSQLL